jgi:selenide,water dikinase
VLLAADMQGLARGEWVRDAHDAMQHTNRVAGQLACDLSAHAATDVTGFGFAGHLLSLLEGGSLVAQISPSEMPFLPGAVDLWKRGMRSTAHPANRAAFHAHVHGATELDEAWLFDPQTAGGLLIAVAPTQVDVIQQSLKSAGEPQAHAIGRLVERGHSGDLDGDTGQIEIHPSAT